MQLTPLIAVHMCAAIGAVLTGPVALWARRGRAQRPRLHRAFGYAWVTLMVVAAGSALFIRDFELPNIAGYTPIHLLVPVTFGMLFAAFRFLARGNVEGHRKTMQRLYLGGCVVAGVFTLLPQRHLGQLLWGQLGLKPGMIGPILANTPLWVWGLLAALVALGLSQARGRRASLGRVTFMPITMTALSLSGTVAAFGNSPLFGEVLMVWIGAAAAMLTLTAPLAPAAGTRYDAASRSFELPGSWTPLVLILGIFLTKYAVGVELAMQPQLAQDGRFTLIVGALYGLFSGIFAGRAARLWRLAARPAEPSSPLVA